MAHMEVDPNRRALLNRLSTRELIDELFARCDHGVVAIFKDNYPVPGHRSRTYRWTGNEHTAAGLAFEVGSKALAAFEKSIRVVPDSLEPPGMG